MFYAIENLNDICCIEGFEKAMKKNRIKYIFISWIKLISFTSTNKWYGKINYKNLKHIKLTILKIN